jgi:hypothetical protein
MANPATGGAPATPNINQMAMQGIQGGMAGTAAVSANAGTGWPTGKH